MVFMMVMEEKKQQPFYNKYPNVIIEQCRNSLRKSLTSKHILHTNIVESELYINGKIEEAIQQAFLTVDKHILQESQVIIHSSDYSNPLPIPTHTLTALHQQSFSFYFYFLHFNIDTNIGK